MIKAGKATVPPPTTVTSAIVKQADWQPTVAAVGSVSPVQGATISAELAGRVSEIDFESGAKVKKVSLCSSSMSPRKKRSCAPPRPTRAGEIGARPRAKSFQGQRDFEGGAGHRTGEIRRSRRRRSTTCRRSIDKKAIRAPFAGVAGIRYVNPGQMVAVGDKLVSLANPRQCLRRFLAAAKRSRESGGRAGGERDDRRDSGSRVQGYSDRDQSVSRSRDAQRAGPGDARE